MHRVGRSSMASGTMHSQLSQTLTSKLAFPYLVAKRQVLQLQ